MKVKINEVLFKKMLDTVKRYTYKTGSNKPALEYIKIVIANETATAYALDGYRAAKTEIKLNAGDADGDFIGFIKPFPFKPSRRGEEYVLIEHNGEATTVEVPTEYGNIRYNFAPPKENFFDIENFYKTTKEHDRELGVSAVFLAECCRDLAKISDKYPHLVVLETKESRVSPFIIRATGDGIKSELVLLPVRFTEGQE